jgi:hypothetical protein
MTQGWKSYIMTPCQRARSNLRVEGSRHQDQGRIRGVCRVMEVGLVIAGKLLPRPVYSIIVRNSWIWDQVS